MLLTFQDSEVRDSLIKGPWMGRWFKMVKPWQGKPANLERFVWLSCSGVTLNSWNADTFRRIGEVWGYFISLDEETLKDPSFAKGKVLIATEEIARIERWIQVVVHGIRYEVLVKEETSSVNLDEVLVELQMKGGRVAKLLELELEVEDDDVESNFQNLANERKGVCESLRRDSTAKEKNLQRKGTGRCEVGGSTQLGAAENLMLHSASDKDDVDDVESVVENLVELGRLHLDQMMGQKCNGLEELGSDRFQEGCVSCPRFFNINNDKI